MSLGLLKHSTDSFKARCVAEGNSSEGSNGEEVCAVQDKEKEVALWVEVAGGVKKGRVYGLAGQARWVGSTSSGSASSGDYWEKKFEEQVKKTETLEQQLSSQSEYIKQTSSRLEQLESWMKQMQSSSSQPPTIEGTGAGNDEEMDDDSEDGSTAYETGEDDRMSP
ncbi:hypothetical protein Tsubulata_036988 [Turnera subulata]|uniref:Uncharacterized protein n=1 Tax=Turnera subulata TaxID=218843 RepID=A0A9Q0JC19_9ROSI|nr:hypothetical protein Tsubulata_036988 [Turnera subulata]